MTIKKKKNLKQRKPFAGSLGTGTRGLSQYDIEVKIGELSSPSANQENIPPSGSDGKQPTKLGARAYSIAETNIRQQTGIMLASMIAEANSLHLTCIKVILTLSPNGEWEMVGNEIRFVGN